MPLYNAKSSTKTFGRLIWLAAVKTVLEMKWGRKGGEMDRIDCIDRGGQPSATTKQTYVSRALKIVPKSKSCSVLVLND